MSTDSTYIKSNAMPAQTIKPLATGATSPMQSAQIHQQEQIQQQMALIGKGKTGGGRTKQRKFRGGSVANNAQIVVPAVQPGAVNSSQTQSQYADLTALASKQESEAVFDSGNTAAVAATQKGGRKIKGGNWHGWGCLSGGSKSKRKHRRHRRKTRKTRKTRNARKTRK